MPSIQLKFPDLSKLGQMVQRVAGKVYGQSENFKKSKRRTIQPKILETLIEQKSNLTVITGEKLLIICAYLVRSSFFPEIPESAVLFASGNFRKFKPAVLVQWKVPYIIQQGKKTSLNPKPRSNFHITERQMAVFLLLCHKPALDCGTG